MFVVCQLIHLLASCSVYSGKYRCVQCGVVCMSKHAPHMHQIRVHSKKKSSTSTVSSSNVCMDVCGVMTDSSTASMSSCVTSADECTCVQCVKAKRVCICIRFGCIVRR